MRRLAHRRIAGRSADRLVLVVVLARVVAWLVSGKGWRSASGWSGPGGEALATDGIRTSTSRLVAFRHGNSKT